MAYPTFRQLGTLLGGKYSASSMAAAEGVTWPPPPSISLRSMLAFQPKVISIPSPQEPCTPRTTVDAGYFMAPPDLLDPSAAPMDCKALTTDGRVNFTLRTAAQDRDGNKILKRVADWVNKNRLVPGSFSQDLIVAGAQLAATGSAAFAAWSANPLQEQDLTNYLISEGVPAADASAASQQILSDFNAARQAVRNPAAGINESSLRQPLRNGNWIAVSGEDDPPDFPVNASIGPYPQYQIPLTVSTPLGPSSSLPISMRCVIASSRNVAGLPCNPTFQGSVPSQPTIPPGDEVVLYIHGEGSRAEEADDFIPALFSVAAAVGRSVTVVAFDQPGCGYSTMVPHLSVAPMPPTSGVPGFIDTSSFSGSPILDFVEAAIIELVETLIVPAGNPITAIVGGSLGGHMALRLAASQKPWVRSVIAWSPASVMDHTFQLGFNIPGIGFEGATLAQRLLTDPVLAQRATDGPNPPWPASPEPAGSRSDFFNTVWCQDTFTPTVYDVAAVAGALIAADLFVNVIADLGAAVIAAAILQLPAVPPQPQMWYRNDWASTPTYITESRLDRREVYNTNFRQWHWRICEEMLGFTFDSLVPKMTKPLLLMVGESDNYPEVHFLSNVTNFAKGLKGPAQGGLTIQDTGHSIHNERPFFLAHQVINFARPA